MGPTLNVRMLPGEIEILRFENDIYMSTGPNWDSNNGEY